MKGVRWASPTVAVTRVIDIRLDAHFVYSDRCGSPSISRGAGKGALAEFFLFLLLLFFFFLLDCATNCQLDNENYPLVVQFVIIFNLISLTNKRK